MKIFNCVFKFGYEKFYSVKENVGILVFDKMAKMISTLEGGQQYTYNLIVTGLSMLQMRLELYQRAYHIYMT